MTTIGNKKVEIYRNLHRDCYSIREDGYVRAHKHNIVVENPRFKVRPGGRERVLREKKKNVHAFVCSDNWASDTTLFIPVKAIQIRYNPYEGPQFRRLDTNEEVFEAKKIWLTNFGMFAIF